MILTTWQLPENEGAISGEKATEVAVLSIRRSLDETGTVVIYRTDAPGTLAACAAADEIVPDANRGALSASFVENAAAGFALVRSIGRAAGRGGNYNFTATDAATNYDQSVAWNLGDNGGTGFAPWNELGGRSPGRSFSPDGAFAVTSPSVSEEGQVGRAFNNNVQLDSGMFSVDATHEFLDKFSGFAVYGDDGKGGYQELLRWGVATRDDDGKKTGFWYSSTGGHDYQFFGAAFNTDPEVKKVPDSVNYTLTWSAIDGDLSFALTAAGNWVNSGSFSFSPELPIEVSGVSAVSAVGILIDGGEGSQYFRFDNLSVEGHIIPEPGTLSLLVLGVAVLGARRRK